MGGKDYGFITTAEGILGAGSSQSVRASQGSGILDQFGRNPGAVRESNARNISLKPSRIAEGILNLTPEQIRNLQIDPKEVDTFRGLLK